MIVVIVGDCRLFRLQHLIADGGSVKMFNLLLEASGTQEHSPKRLELLNVRDANNQTPLIHCVKHGRGELAAALLQQVGVFIL